MGIILKYSNFEEFALIIVHTIDDLKQEIKKLNGSIGFVPTMGALHDGHISLIKKSSTENDFTVVSIFVNPTQFLVGEDLDKYPRKITSDTKICELARVDILFMPQISDMYGADEVLIKAPNIRGYLLEGFIRPGHFDGVLQVVLKLLHLVRPSRAYFGKKDAQQLALISQMVRDLFLDVEIVPCDIVRDSDGLALSSRNVYLDSEERSRALAIPKSIKKAAKMVGEGEMNAAVLEAMMAEVMCEIEVQYIAFVDRAFHKIKTVQLGNTIILVAAKVGNTRLIDNIWI